MNFTHQQLANAGRAVIGNEVVPITTPDPTWDLESLTAYVKNEIAEFTLLSKRGTFHLYRAGHALSLIRAMRKSEKTWVKWQRDNKLPRTTVNDAIRVYEGAESEEGVADLTLMEAYDRFGIAKRGKATAPNEFSEDTPQTSRNERNSHDEGDEPHSPEALEQDNERSSSDAVEEGEEPPSSEALEEAENEEFRAYQQNLREESLLTKATVIRNALELLVEEMKNAEVTELKETINQIVAFAEAAREIANGQAA